MSTRARDTADVVEDVDVKLASKPTRTVATTEPSNPQPGDLWFDSTDTPPTPYYYDGVAEEFVPFPSGVGNADFSDAATGTYTDDGIDYKYITFTASGTLTVTEEGLADVLVVGGGGGGAKQIGGGGGAGGHFYATDAYLPVGTLTVTVGAGGSSNAAGDGRINGAQNGNASRLHIYAAVGGGNSDGGEDMPGNTGGSGGGAATGRGAIGLGFSGQGNDGGLGQPDGTTANGAGGGGGGAGGVGANGGVTNRVGGAGGNGLANSITGSSVTRAGGGGGGGNNGAGAGGSGGGGAGATSGTAGSGTANTGGGGGGAASGTAGSGGSGVVIVRVRTN